MPPVSVEDATSEPAVVTVPVVRVPRPWRMRIVGASSTIVPGELPGALMAPMTASVPVEASPVSLTMTLP